MYYLENNAVQATSEINAAQVVAMENIDVAF
jgi:hypothetical protein